MWERYTEQYRRVLLCSQRIAAARGVAFIEPPDVYQALCLERPSVLGDLPPSARRETKRSLALFRKFPARAIVSNPQDTNLGQLTFSESTSRVIALAENYADLQNVQHVGTEHLSSAITWRAVLGFRTCD